MSKSRPWQIFALLSLLYVIAYFYRVSAAVIAPDLTADLSLSPAQLGNVSAALFYAFAIAQLPLGPLLDRFGPRRIVTLFGLATAGGALLFAAAGGYAEALWGRILIGAGTSCVLMGSLKAYTAWFPPGRFATLAGLQVAIGNAGNLLATAPLAYMAAGLGWRGVFGVMALLSTLAALAVLALVRDAPPGVSPPAGRPSLGSGWRELVRRPGFWSLALLAFFWYGTYMAVQGLWGGPYLVEVLGVDQARAGELLLFIPLGFIVGSPLAGRLSDRLGGSRQRVLLPGQLALLLLASLFLGPLAEIPRPLLPGVFFLFGLAVSTGPLLYAQVKEEFPPELSATAMTGVNFFVMLGAAMVQQGMGRMVAAAPQGGAEALRHAFWLPVAGLAAAWIVGLSLSRWKKPTKMA